MTSPAKSQAGAGRVLTLVTNESDRHSAHDWARVTTKQLVDLDYETSAPRLAAGQRLRARMFEELYQGFQHVVSERALQSDFAVDAIARHTAERTLDQGRGSPWEEQFADPQTRTSLALVIWRNIHDAAALTARTE
jgi:hypothetical protein